MADYRRFISYMYLYENGRKTGNSGFVRVESRNDQCRVHIHMTGIYGPEDALYEIYMLIRESGGYIGIAVGRLGIQQQTGERDLLTDSSHLMGTDYGLERVSGMVVLSGDGRVYGTRWDDEPLETECFFNQEKLSDSLVLFHSQERVASEVKERVQAEILRQAGEQEEIGAEIAEITDKEEAIEEDAIKREEIENEEIENERIENEAVKQEATENEAKENEAKENEVEENAVTEDVVQSYEQKSIKDNIYENLLHQYPQMYPFDDDSIEICVRLDLQDIGMLPMQCWLYGSNSFLLHGYYCYRHLILAKVQTHVGNESDNDIDHNDSNEVETSYILGVPGIRQHQEQYMASMFGFHNFKPVSHENTGKGAFGYWYIKLK